MPTSESWQDISSKSFISAHVENLNIAEISRCLARSTCSAKRLAALKLLAIQCRQERTDPRSLLCVFPRSLALLSEDRHVRNATAVLLQQARILERLHVRQIAQGVQPEML